MSISTLAKNILSIFKKLRGIVFAFLLLFISLFVESSRLSQVHKILHTLSFEQRKQLELFFYDIFALNELGYTLFGDKPLSFCWPNTLKPHFSKRDYSFKIYSEDTIPLFKGFSVWKKISSYINKNYLLIIYEDKKYPEFTILINKKSFEIEFKKNVDLFRKLYGTTVTAELVLNDLKKKTNFNELRKTPLFQNDALLGIVLGFGRHNAELFQRREQLMQTVFSLVPFSQSRGFSSIEEEIEYLWLHLQPSRNTHDWLLKVNGVGFVADRSDPETHRLINKYEALHKKLIKIFDQENWLEKVLAKLL